MKFKKEDIMDLNEENVKSIFNYCLATKDSTDYFKAEFINETAAMKLPNIFFSREKVREKSLTIRYLIGQLDAVHQDKHLLGLLDGFKKYDGTDWTSNKGTLFMLYYLGSSVSLIPFFKPIPARKTYMSAIYGKLGITQTYSPNDPNFKDEPDGIEL